MFDFIIFIAIAIPVLYIIVLINSFIINLCMSHAPKYKRLYQGNLASIVFKSAGAYTLCLLILSLLVILYFGIIEWDEYASFLLFFIVPPALIPPITLLIIPISIFLLERKQGK